MRVVALTLLCVSCLQFKGRDEPVAESKHQLVESVVEHKQHRHFHHNGKARPEPLAGRDHREPFGHFQHHKHSKKNVQVAGELDQSLKLNSLPAGVKDRIRNKLMNETGLFKTPLMLP